MSNILTYKEMIRGYLSGELEITDDARLCYFRDEEQKQLRQLSWDHGKHFKQCAERSHELNPALWTGNVLQEHALQYLP
jgi:hypothetical protein